MGEQLAQEFHLADTQVSRVLGLVRDARAAERAHAQDESFLEIPTHLARNNQLTRECIIIISGCQFEFGITTNNTIEHKQKPIFAIVIFIIIVLVVVIVG